MKHFLHVNPCCYYTARELENVKFPLEGMIWYAYAGQALAYYPGKLDKPSDVGRVLSDGSTQITRYTYNAYGLITRKTDPDGRVTVNTYAPNGIDLVQVQQKVDSGFDTLASYTYNNQHEPLSYTDASGSTTTYTYNGRGQRTSITDPLGQTTQYSYDGNGYLVAVINPLGHVELRLTYDAYGRIATDTDVEGYTRGYQYDALDRLVSIDYPDHTSRRFVWDKLDLASTTDRQGNTTTFGYDAERHRIAVTDPLGRTTRYGYYPNGKRHTMTDPSGNVTTWTRDLEGRVIAKTYPDGLGTTFTYDNSSRLASETDALGQTKVYSYDAADLLTGIQYTHAIHPTASVVYAYDPYYPRLDGMSDGLGITSLDYVPVGQPGALRPSSETGPFSANDTVRYEYDARGRVIRRTTDVETDYAFDPLGRLSQESNALGTFHYDFLGDTNQSTARSLMTPSRGHRTLSLTAEYDSNQDDRQLRQLAYRAGEHRLTALLSYTHSPAHMLTSARTVAPWLSGPHRQDGDDEDGTDAVDAWVADDHDHDNQGHGAWGRGDHQRYSYDPAYRLIEVKDKKRDTWRFDYDAADNLVQASGGPSSFTATTNTLNQLATVNGQAWQYDADGQLLTDGTHQYAWDAAGRLIALTDLGTGRLTAYRYDGLGRRLAISSQGGGATPVDLRYLWCGMSICQARDGNDAVLADYFNQGETHGTAALYYVRDQLGSVIGVTDAAGKVLGATRYGAYGTVEWARGVQPDFGYAGMLRDPSASLYLTRFREYDPAVGRWISRDPIGERGGENIYAYVGGNPLMYTDPYGLWELPSLPQWFVDGATGFGDGVYSGITFDLGDLQDVRDLMGINGGIDRCSKTYRFAHVAGAIEGGVALGGSLAAKSFVPGGWTNSNRYLRIGYGRNGGNQVFRAAGQWIEGLTGNAHVDFWIAGKW